MRNRFFFIIFATLIFSGISFSWIHAHFFETQRIKLIDRHLAEASEALMRAPDFQASLKSRRGVREALGTALSGARIGKIFVIRDDGGKVIYQSEGVNLLKLEFQNLDEWSGVESENEYVRVHTVPITDFPGYILQIGSVMDRNFLNWQIVDDRVINYMLGFTITIFLASAVLTLVLLDPQRLLIRHLRDQTTNLISMKPVQPLPANLTRYTRNFWSKSDEFSVLILTMQRLIDRINLNYKLTRSWTFQMAHELKTPLAILRAETEDMRAHRRLNEDDAKAIFQEIDQMSGQISQFLEWAELENSQAPTNLHSMRMRQVVENVAGRFATVGQGRLKVKLSSDFPVLANPHHLEQVISNLVTNALKFSPAGSAVEIDVTDHTLKVIDQGKGLPQEVRERFGQPFNVGSDDSRGPVGSGLGLAWVNTVSGIYEWGFNMEHGARGTEASVTFPRQIVET